MKTRDCRILSFMLVLVAGFLCPAFATTYYVAANGNDSSSGLSKTTPWATIDNGDRKSILQPGDTVLVLAGTYSGREVLLSNRGGTPGLPVTYRAYGGSVTVNRAESTTEASALRVANIGNVVVSGLEFTGCSRGITLENAANVEISNCTVYGLVKPVVSGQPRSLSVERCSGCWIHHNQLVSQSDPAVLVSTTGYGNRFHNNTIYSRDIPHAAPGLDIRNGTVAGVDPANSGLQFVNNIVWVRGGLVVRVSGGVSLAHSHNLFWTDDGSQVVMEGDSLHSSEVVADPMFGNAAALDFRPLPGSPAIDSGFDVGLPYAGAAPNLGALESMAPPASTRISAIRDLTLGTSISLSEAKPATVNSSAFADGSIWVEEPDRSAGIRVIPSSGNQWVDQGQFVVAAGVVSEIAGERVIAQAVLTPRTGTLLLEPVGIPQRALGVSEPSPLGLLVRIWGRVTAVGADYFYVDDGSALNDGTGPLGVRVSHKGLVLPFTRSPHVGDYLSVTGLAGRDVVSNVSVLVVRVRGDHDVTVQEGEQPALPPRTLITPPSLRDVPAWVRSNTRPSHLPPPAWDQINMHLDAGVTSLCVNMMTSWYKVGPTAYLYSPAEVAAADQSMRQYVQAVHAKGAKALFYAGPVHVPSLSPEFKAAHPDWLTAGPNGVSQDLGNFRSGYGDWLVNQLAYVVRTYGVDGFWFDGYSGRQYSYDARSQLLFRGYSGQSIPNPVDPKTTIGQTYLKWFWKGYVDFADRIRGAIRAENPDAVIFANYSSAREWYLPNDRLVEYPAVYANAVDIPSLEQWWTNPGDETNQHFVDAFLQGVSHGRGAAIWMQPSAYGVTGVCPEVEFRLRYLQGAIWGTYTEFVEPTGRDEYVAMWSADMKAREEWLAASDALPWIGIVASEQTKMTYGLDSSFNNYLCHILGAFGALMEAHRPVRVLTEYDLEDDNLQGVRVLVLPNTACLSDRSVEVIRRFVERGGGLVATYETSLFNEVGTKRADFALKDLFRASYQSRFPVLSRDAAIPLYATAAHPITSDPFIEKSKWATAVSLPDGRMMMVASAVKSQALSGGQTVMTFREVPYGTSSWPAAVVSQYGLGKVVYFPAAIDKALFFYPGPNFRQMLRNACDWAAGSAPPVEVDAPSILAATFRTQPEKRRTIVHLFNDASSWGRHSLYQKVTPAAGSDMTGQWPVRSEVIPIANIRVTCRISGVTKATLQPEGLNLPLQPVSGGVRVTVPEVALHSMVVFE